MTTESDRELLELAAKAAGDELIEGFNGDMLRVYRIDPYNGLKRYKRWNPIEDDGDALRLVVKLELDVTRYSEHEVAITGRAPTHGTPGIYLTERQPLGSDPYAATRRAIVRAAAEIARATHKEQT